MFEHSRVSQGVKGMKSKIFESVAVILMAAPMSAMAGDITYYVEEAIGTGSVVGTIETDGKTGVLSSADVLAWDLTLRAPQLSGGTPQVLTQSNGTFSDTGGFGVVGNDLVFNYAGTSGQLFIFEGGSHSDYWCGAASGGDACNGETDPAVTIGPSTSGGDAEVVSETGVKVIATAVPAPTTLAMLSFGLLALGLVRRNNAI